MRLTTYLKNTFLATDNETDTMPSDRKTVSAPDLDCTREQGQTCEREAIAALDELECLQSEGESSISLRHRGGTERVAALFAEATDKLSHLASVGMKALSPASSRTPSTHDPVKKS